MFSGVGRVYIVYMELLNALFSRACSLSCMAGGLTLLSIREWSCVRHNVSFGPCEYAICRYTTQFIIT